MRTSSLALMVMVLGLLAPLSAQAKAWRNVTPGATRGIEVVKRFGEPTKRLTRGPKTVLAYYEDEALEGTKQAEFIIDEAGKVEQIAIFPSSVVDKAAIGDTYGPSCSEKQAPNCYVEKVSEDDLKTYFWYENLGLVVFFNSDGKTVASFLYVKPGPPKQPAAAAKPKTSANP